MQFSDIEKDYIVLFNLPREEKTILVCRKKADAKYDFFVQNGLEYQFVDSDTEKELRKQFTSHNDIGIFFYEPFSLGEENGKSKVEFEKKVNSKVDIIAIKKSILNFANEIDFDVKNKVLTRLKDVELREDADNDPLVPAYYMIGENSVYVNPNNLGTIDVLALHILTHEFLHCASAKAYGVDCGFSNAMLVKPEQSDNNCGVIVGNVLNECFTEIFSEEILREKYANIKEYKESFINTGYYLCAKLVKALYDQMDKKAVKQAFFEANVFKFYDIFAKTFHIKDKNQIVRFDFLLEALKNIIENKERTLVRDYEKTDMKICLAELGKLVCDFIVNKYFAENKSLKNKKLADFFGKELTSERFANLIEKLSSYFEAIKIDCRSQHQSENLKSILDVFTREVVERITNGTMEFNVLPEKFKTVEMYSLLLHAVTIDKVLVADKKVPIMKSAKVYDVFKALFNPKNCYLPKDIIKQKEIVQKYVEKCGMFQFDLLSLLPKPLVLDCINSSDSNFSIAYKGDIDFVLNNIKDIDTQKTTSNAFTSHLLKRMHLQKDDVCKSMIERYCSGFGENKSLAAKHLKRLIKQDNFLCERNFDNFFKNLENQRSTKCDEESYVKWHWKILQQI